jgi:hypothetical protein
MEVRQEINMTNNIDLKMLFLSIKQRLEIIPYVIQNYWVFGLYPLSGILETRNHNVSKTGFVSLLG